MYSISLSGQNERLTISKQNIKFKKKINPNIDVDIYIEGGE